MKIYQIYALIAMIFAGFTSVIAKAGLKNVSGDAGLAVRTIFVFGIVLLNLLVFKHYKDLAYLSKKDILLLGLSGLTTSISWIFYYKAIKIGNVSEVALIDKGSILVTLLLSVWFLQETLTWRTIVGGLLVVSGLIVLTTK